MAAEKDSAESVFEAARDNICMRGFGIPAKDKCNVKFEDKSRPRVVIKTAKDESTTISITLDIHGEMHLDSIKDMILWNLGLKYTRFICLLFRSERNPKVWYATSGHTKTGYINVPRDGRIGEFAGGKTDIQFILHPQVRQILLLSGIYTSGI